MAIQKILLGGVPFGCNNIGDEAILARVVSIVREINPESDITVSTAAPLETSNLLNVKTCPLYGFDVGVSRSEHKLNKKRFIGALKEVELFIWAGATGLSDYPGASLSCLIEAQKLNLKTIIFCTGMNDQLNPAHFKLSSGKKFALLNFLTLLSGRNIDFLKTYEIKKENALRKSLKDVLDKCDLVINRDRQSCIQLMRSQLVQRPIIAADPAITLPILVPSEKIWGNALIDFMNTPKKLIGICISSQQNLAEQEQFTKWLDHIIQTKNVKIVFIPMNPITDFDTMATIKDGMQYQSETIIANGSNTPEAFVGLASKMNIIISSRLHLLIFASISATPCIGIERGSKVRNFLSEFGQYTTGTTEHIDFQQLEKTLTHLLFDPSEYKAKAKSVRYTMLIRLNIGIKALSKVLNPSLP